MNIPVELLEGHLNNLPDANQFIGTCFPYEFEYNNHYYQLKYYVVSDMEGGNKYWLYNPYHVQGISKDGSHQVIK